MSQVRTKPIKLILLAAAALNLCASLAGAETKKNRFVVLYNFSGGKDSGAAPFGSLIQDASGNFYGATTSGGTISAGTIFRLTPEGSETVLYSFTDGSDGGLPIAGPILDAQGNLFGTTYAAGDQTCNCGVVYKIDTSGRESVVHTFRGGSDGATPYGGLTMDGSSNIYGATYNGGGTCNCGTVFKLAPDGTETIMHVFAGGNDGANPYASVLLDKHGNLYGASYQGGGGCNCGTIFKIDSSGSESVLYAFQGNTDGSYPETSLIMNKAGELFGATKFGGAGGGTVFKLARDNTETVLHAFQGGADGASPFAGVVMDKQGNLYGTTQQSGGANAGTVFKLTPRGQETILHSFNAGRDGYQPFAPLFLDTKNELVGTAAEGGRNGFGTVFRVKVKN